MGKGLLIGMLLLAYGHASVFPGWAWMLAIVLFVWELMCDVERFGTMYGKIEIQGFEEIYGGQVRHHLRRSLHEASEEEEAAEQPGPDRNLSKE